MQHLDLSAPLFFQIIQNAHPQAGQREYNKRRTKFSELIFSSSDVRPYIFDDLSAQSWTADRLSRMSLDVLHVYLRVGLCAILDQLRITPIPTIGLSPNFRLQLFTSITTANREIEFEQSDGTPRPLSFRVSNSTAMHSATSVLA